GRDIGTVVLPAAEVKVFLTASGPARARRRAGERAGGDPAVVQDHLARRDALDSSRADSPLAVAPGAVVIDTSELSIEEVVGAVLACLPRRRP
ncbi:MAG: (d)CMP kinase, partial [Acidimicrobiales bacterium]